MRKTRSRNEGFPGDHISPVRSHTPVYTVVPVSALALLFDLSRVASLGAFFYPIMAMPVQLATCDRCKGHHSVAPASDVVVPVAFTKMQLGSDPMIVLYALVGIGAVFAFQRI